VHFIVSSFCECGIQKSVFFLISILASRNDLSSAKTDSKCLHLFMLLLLLMLIHQQKYKQSRTLKKYQTIFHSQLLLLFVNTYFILRTFNIDFKPTMKLSSVCECLTTLGWEELVKFNYLMLHTNSDNILREVNKWWK